MSATFSTAVGGEAAITPAARNIEAHTGNGLSQVAVGDNNLLIHADHGAVVNVLQNEVRVDRRPSPVSLPPLAFPGLLGRAVEVSTAKATLAIGQPFEFYADAGWGKTALLRYLGPLAAGSFPDGIVYQPSSGEPLADLLQFLFDAFYQTNVPFKPTDGQLRQFLKPIRALVLVDDLGLQRDEVESLLTSLPGCAFLVASRERTLWGMGQSQAVTGLSKEASAELFERELGRLISPTDQPAFQQLWTSVGGNPLSLIEAASLVREKGRALANLTMPAATPQQLTSELVATVSDDQRKVLGLLASVYDAALPASHVAAITGASGAADILAQLTAQGLVEREGSGYRFKREPSAAVSQAVIADQWKEPAIKHFSAWAKEFGGHTLVILEVADALLKVLDLASETQRHWFEVAQLVRSLEQSLELSGRWGAWERVLHRGLQAASALGDRGLKAWSLHQLGSRSLCLGAYEEARSFLNQALGLRQAMGDHEGARVTQHNIDRLNTLTSPPRPADQDTTEKPKPDKITPTRTPLRSIIVKTLGILAGAAIAIAGGKAAVDAMFGGQLIFEPSSQIDLGTVALGQTGEAQVQIHNTGRGDLVLVPIPAAVGDFTVSTGCPTAPAKLGPGQACPIQIRFRPSQAGSRTSQLQVTEQGGNVHELQLSGIGASAVVRLPSSLDFGRQAAGITSGAKAVTLSNAGNDSLSNIEIGSSGDFRIETNNCPPVLAAGQACSISVTMTPAAVGPRTGTLTVSDRLGTQTVALRGTGIMTFTLTPNPADFGTVMVGKRAVQRIMLTNTSGVPLVLKQITTSTKDFLPGSTCQQQLVQPQASCPIPIAFSPVHAGARTDTLVVIASSGDEQDDALTGNAPALSLDPSFLDFNGQVAVKAVTATNVTTGPLDITSVDLNSDVKAFAKKSDGCSKTTLAAGAHCDVTIWYVPNPDSSPVPDCAQLIFSDSDASSPQVVDVRGRGQCSF